MRDRRSISGARGARYVLVVAALALFGLLSMHGWGTHAGTHGESGHAPTLVAVHGKGHHTTHADSSIAPVAAAAVGDANPAACDGGCGDTGTGLAGMCLAILSGLVLALAMIARRRRIRLLWAALKAQRYLVSLGREPDPPDLLRLCVIRC